MSRSRKSLSPDLALREDDPLEAVRASWPSEVPYSAQDPDIKSHGAAIIWFDRGQLLKPL